MSSVADEVNDGADLVAAEGRVEEDNRACLAMVTTGAYSEEVAFLLRNAGGRALDFLKGRAEKGRLKNSLPTQPYNKQAVTKSK